MNILALDPATKCGWAISPEVSGTWDLSIRRDESSGMRLIRLEGKLNEILQAHKIDLLVYEAARHSAPKMQGALVVQATLQGVIVLWAEKNNIEYQGFSPSEIKKHATGKGNASKEKAVWPAAKQRWPHVNFETHDQADAVWLLDLAQTRYGQG